MDRSAWLEVQPWLLPWTGCSISSPCSACALHKYDACSCVDWFFSGYGWFHLPSDVEDRQEPPSKDAPILTFLGSPDPEAYDAQLKINIGVLANDSCSVVDGISFSTCLLVQFDGNQPFILHPQKVTGVSIWTEEKCEECMKQSAADKAKICSLCENAPSHITINTRHVALNISSVDDFAKQASDAAGKPSSFSRLFNCVQKIQEEAKLQLIGQEHLQEQNSTMSTNELLSNVQVQRQQFSSSLDFICQSVNGAVDVCSANPQWMAEILSDLVNSVHGKNDKKSMLQRLQFDIQKALNSCEEKEAELFDKLLGLNLTEQDFLPQARGLTKQQCSMGSNLREQDLSDQSSCLIEQLSSQQSSCLTEQLSSQQSSLTDQEFSQQSSCLTEEESSQRPSPVSGIEELEQLKEKKARLTEALLWVDIMLL